MCGGTLQPSPTLPIHIRGFYLLKLNQPLYLLSLLYYICQNKLLSRRRICDVPDPGVKAFVSGQ